MDIQVVDEACHKHFDSVSSWKLGPNGLFCRGGIHGVLQARALIVLEPYLAGLFSRPVPYSACPGEHLCIFLSCFLRRPLCVLFLQGPRRI